MKRFGYLGLVMYLTGSVLFGCDINPYDDDDDDEKESDPVKDTAEPDAGPPVDLTKCAYAEKEYRNFFLEIDVTEDQVAARIEDAWASLFEGDSENETVYYEAGSNEDGPMAYILDVASDDVRSEGMSYGMMISVQLDKQDEFDALWNWAKTYMWHGDKGHPFYEYFAWNLDTEGNAFDDAPAPDGEEYFAMALYFASSRWGDGDGIYDYRKEADRLVSALKNRETVFGEYMDRGNLSSDAGHPIFHPDHKMVRFSPKSGYFSTSQGDHTDPSYHLPAFYQLWSIFGPEDDRDFWADAAKVSRNFFVEVAHPDTALTPDYAHFNGEPVQAAWDSGTAHFRADARRTVMNWSMDWAWFCADERERELSDTLQAFFIDSVGSQYVALYELDGTPLDSNYYSTSVIAMNATSALSATDAERSEKFVTDLWYLSVPTGQYRYYDGMLYMFALLHVSGNFKIYDFE